jgi:hypothetical protein
VTRRRILAALALTILIAGATGAPVAAEEHDQPAVKTGKERLTDKASDEQRVDDCKVAQAKRSRPRPTDCTGG